MGGPELSLHRESTDSLIAHTSILSQLHGYSIIRAGGNDCNLVRRESGSSDIMIINEMLGCYGFIYRNEQPKVCRVKGHNAIIALAAAAPFKALHVGTQNT